MKEIFLYYIQIVPTTIYWLSIIVIGLAVFKLLSTKIKLNNAPGLINNPFIVIVASFMSGSFLLGLVALLAYLASVPAIIFTVTYLFILSVSLVYLSPLIIKYFSKNYKISINPRKHWIAIIITALTISLLVGDYTVGTYFGAQFAEGSDSYVHVARILSITTFGFTIEDSFLKGVFETRYHMNAIYALYIPLVQLLQVSPADAWGLSMGFFRSIQWISIGGLAYFLYDRYFIKSRKSSKALWFGCSAIILSICFFAGRSFMHVAVYPNKVTVLWFIFLLIGLILLMSKKSKVLGSVLLLMSATLITLTHPTYALMAAVYIGLIISFLFIGNLFKFLIVRREVFLILAGSMFLLMISPLITVSFPDRMTIDSFEYGDFKTINLFGVDILPVASTPLPWLILSLIGYFYLLVRTSKKSRVESVVLIVMILFVYLTASNPIFMYIVNDKLPLWLVSRFSAMNVLYLVSVLIGIYALTLIVKHLIRGRARYVFFSIAAVPLLIVLSKSVIQEYRLYYSSTRGIDAGYLKFIHRTEDELVGIIPPGSIVMANLGDSYFLPAVIPVRVIAVHDSHATPMADSKNRMMCQDEIIKKQYSKPLLATVDADFIVLAKWETNFNELKMKLESDSGIIIVKDTSDFLVYKIDKESLPPKLLEGSCYQYQKNEQTIP